MYNKIRLSSDVARIRFPCEVLNERYQVWVDTGSPNTLVHMDFLDKLKLKPSRQRFTGNVAGTKFIKQPSILIPEIKVTGCLPLQNVRAITAFSSDEWSNIILLGLNVLNHISFKVDREKLPGFFEWTESLTNRQADTGKTRFDHIIWGGKYLLMGVDENNDYNAVTRV